MNLYRLDTPRGPVCDILGVRLIRSYAVACDIAHDVADHLQESVSITRISGAGAMRRVRLCHPGRGSGDVAHLRIGRESVNVAPMATTENTAQGHAPGRDTEETCHCGTSYGGSDHCRACGCEQYESTTCYGAEDYVND